MKVKDVIEYLKEYKEDEEILIAWLDYEMFDDHEDVSYKAWVQTCKDWIDNDHSLYELVSNYYLVTDTDLANREKAQANQKIRQKPKI